MVDDLHERVPLRRHHYPNDADSRKLAVVLRAVADNFDVQE